MEDFELLQEYAERGSEQAFAELVGRHVNLVYSTGLRVVSESQLAEDVAQLVFIQLARKARSIRRGTILTGWLYRTTRHVAQTVLRSERLRNKREQIAMELRELETNSERIWEGLAPLLERAMQQLRPADQDAVLLRFFESKSLREVGQALSISDNAAQKRVNRALECLRRYFVRHGVALSAVDLAPVLSRHAIQAGPPRLAADLLSASLACHAKVGGWKAVLSVVKGLAMTKLAISAVFAGALIVWGMLVFKASSSTGQLAALEPAETFSPTEFVLRGKVRTGGGQPVANALVRLATQQKQLRLYETSNVSKSPSSGRTRAASAQDPGGLSTTTGPDGTFSFALKRSPWQMKLALLVDCEEGYALTTAHDLLSNGDVIVAPWGRIEGELLVGKMPGANQVVNLGIWGSEATYDWSYVSHTVSTRTDERGRFAFARVAPGDVWLTRTVVVRPGDGRQSGHHFMRVAAGQTNRVTLGGAGRTLTGRVIWDSPEKLVFHGSMWAQGEHNLRPPRGWGKMTTDERRSYERAWRDSAEGQLFKREVRNYEFSVPSSGEFRVEDVLPAHYRLQVRAERPRLPGRRSEKDAVAEIELDVSAGDEQEMDVLDIGELRPDPSGASDGE